MRILILCLALSGCSTYIRDSEGTCVVAINSAVPVVLETANCRVEVK